MVVRLRRELHGNCGFGPRPQTKGESVMHASDVDYEPGSYLDAVGALARSERVPPAMVEDLLRPELSEWVSTFHEKPLRLTELRDTLNGRLRDWVEKEGIRSGEAALHLGMTERSFDKLLELHLPNLGIRAGQNGSSGILKRELDDFRDAYLPKFKTWSSRTSLLNEFFCNLERQVGFKVEPQPCEIDDCEQLAAVVCENVSCRSGGSPRKVCFTHRERLRDPIEKSLCAVCVGRVLHGDLKGAFRIAGTEARLLRDYPE
jgi:hypothetical protein